MDGSGDDDAAADSSRGPPFWVSSRGPPFWVSSTSLYVKSSEVDCLDILELDNVVGKLASPLFIDPTTPDILATGGAFLADAMAALCDALEMGFLNAGFEEDAAEDTEGTGDTEDTFLIDPMTASCG